MDFHPYAELFPMMSPAEMAELRADMRENGYRKELPIIVYEMMILDGRNRYAAALAEGICPEYADYKGGDALAYVISTNLHRRHLSSGQRAAIALDLEAMYAEKAKARQGQRTDLFQFVEKSEPVHAAKQAADALGTNTQYVVDAKNLKENDPELFDRVKAGTMTLPQAKQESRRREVKDTLESIAVKEAKEIEGVYDVVVIDPPWPIEKIERNVAPNQVAFDYPTMTTDEIASMYIHAADDCHVFLWTTQKYLPIALDILGQSWGLRYVCTFVWHKPGGFQPFGLPQYNCEFAIYARRGTPQFLDFKDFKTCFDAPRTGHSEKPEEFYSLLRRVTAGRRLDMFSRREIEGFEGWGKEAA